MKHFFFFFGDLIKWFVGGNQHDSIRSADQEELAGNQEKTKFLFGRMLFKKSADGKKTGELPEKPLLSRPARGAPAVAHSRTDNLLEESLASRFRYFTSEVNNRYSC